MYIYIYIYAPLISTLVYVYIYAIYYLFPIVFLLPKPAKYIVSKFTKVIKDTRADKFQAENE